MLTIETIKVNCIYFLEEHKETIEGILMGISAPIWIGPALLFAAIFFALGVNSEDKEIDRNFCKTHGLKYPENAFIPHQAVNKMRREIKRKEAARKKELIRQRLREKQ